MPNAQYPYYQQDPMASMIGQSMPTATSGRNRVPDLLGGLPVPGGPLGQLLVRSWMLPAAQRAAYGQGMMMGGVDTRGQNMMSIQRRLREQQELQRAFAATRDAETENLNRTWGPGMSQYMAQAMPIMSQLGPDAQRFASQIAGPDGSVSGLVNSLFDSRHMRRDSVTGQFGVSGASLGQTASSLARDMYTYTRKNNMMGITLDEVGGAYDFLTRQGRIGGIKGTTTSRARDALIQLQEENPSLASDILDSAGVSTGEATSLSDADVGAALKVPELQSKMRKINADQVRTNLEPYKEMLSAVKEIFGSDGNPNAPMQQIMAAIESLTGGSQKVTDTARTGMMLREMNNLARTSGMSPAGRNMVAQQSSAMANAAGLDGTFGLSLANSNLAFRTSYLSQQLGATPGWGQSSIDQLSGAQLGLTASAASSAMSNRISAFMRMSEGAGGSDGLRGEAKQVYEAIQQGESEYGDGKKIIDLKTQDFAKLAGEGVTGGTATGYMSHVADQFANSEYTEKYAIQDLVFREGQSRHVFSSASRMAAAASRNIMQDKFGLNRSDATTISKLLESANADLMTEIDVGDVANAGRFREKSGDAMMQTLANSTESAAKEVHLKLTQMSPEEREGFLGSVSEVQRGAIDTFARQRVAGANSAVDLVSLYGRQSRDGVQIAKVSAKAMALTERAMSGVGRRGLVDSISRGFAELDGGPASAFTSGGSLTADGARALGVALGGVSLDETIPRLSPVVHELTEKQKEYQEITVKLSDSKLSPKERAKLSREQESLAVEVGVLGSEIDGILGPANLQTADIDDSYMDELEILQGNFKESGNVLSEAISSDKVKDRGELLTGNSEDAIAFRQNLQLKERSRALFTAKTLHNKNVGRHLSPETMRMVGDANTQNERVLDLADLFAEKDMGKLMSGNVSLNKESLRSAGAGYDEDMTLQQLRDKIRSEVDAADDATELASSEVIAEVRQAKDRGDVSKYDGSQRKDLMRELGIAGMRFDDKTGQLYIRRQSQDDRDAKVLKDAEHVMKLGPKGRKEWVSDKMKSGAFDELSGQDIDNITPEMILEIQSRAAFTGTDSGKEQKVTVNTAASIGLSEKQLSTLSESQQAVEMHREVESTVNTLEESKIKVPTSGTSGYNRTENKDSQASITFPSKLALEGTLRIEGNEARITSSAPLPRTVGAT